MFQKQQITNLFFKNSHFGVSSGGRLGGGPLGSFGAPPGSLQDPLGPRSSVWQLAHICACLRKKKGQVASLHGLAATINAPAETIQWGMAPGCTLVGVSVWDSQTNTENLWGYMRGVICEGAGSDRDCATSLPNNTQPSGEPTRHTRTPRVGSGNCPKPWVP